MYKLRSDVALQVESSLGVAVQLDIEDELSNHPAFAPQNGGIIGTGTMYVLNASMVNGVSNIDLLARNDRELRAKYIDGMHSLDASRNNSSVAFSGFDGGRFDLLSEVLPIIYSTESCGIIKATAKFAGGALQAERKLGTNDRDTLYQNKVNPIAITTPIAAGIANNKSNPKGISVTIMETTRI